MIDGQLLHLLSQSNRNTDCSCKKKKKFSVCRLPRVTTTLFQESHDVAEFLLARLESVSRYHSVRWSVI